ncbi:hypothetical protein AAVH_21622 [Aphelenchoides avenae]|nr:hypothetical protein AAVH_21622 [Aphelenchus avenae]
MASTPSSTPPTIGDLPDRWYPVVAFYFLYEVGVEQSTLDDITAFLSNYAACGPAPYLTVLLPRKVVLLEFGCRNAACMQPYMKLTVDDLVVRRGERTNFIPNFIRYVGTMAPKAPYAYRYAYGLTNVNCTVTNDYPDIAKTQIMRDGIMSLASVDLGLEAYWIDVCFRI